MSETSTLEVTVAAKSDPGLIRKENQDRMTRFYSPFGEVFLVTDGMGGHRGGAKAAAMVEEGFTRYLRSLPPDTPIELAIRMAAEKTNAEVVRESRSGSEETAGMGATLVLAILRGNDAVIAHVGDSRAYLYRSGELRVLTRDHTRGQDKVEAGLLSEDDAWDDPDSSVLTRAFGHSDPLAVDVSSSVPLQSGDQLLLCSDGLCGYVKDRTISSVLAQGFDAKRAVEKLVQLANEAGGEDNITVQIILVGPEHTSVRHGERTVVEKTRIPTQPEGPSRNLKPILAGVVAALALAGIALGVWMKFRPEKASTPPATHTGTNKVPESKPAPGPDVAAQGAGSAKESQNGDPVVFVMADDPNVGTLVQNQHAKPEKIDPKFLPKVTNAVLLASQETATVSLARNIYQALNQKLKDKLITMRAMEAQEVSNFNKEPTRHKLGGKGASGNIVVIGEVAQPHSDSRATKMVAESKKAKKVQKQNQKEQENDTKTAPPPGEPPN